MTLHARPSQPARRSRALLIALALLTILALISGLFPPSDGARAQEIPGLRVRVTGNPNSPGSDWVAAERISFTGCIDRGSFGDCFGRTEHTTGLYEQYTRRRSVGRSYDQATPPAPSPIFSGMDRQPCIAGGIFQFWPAGKWHFGRRWTRTMSYGQLEYSGSAVILPVNITWSQAGTHAWAFYPDDQCPTTPMFNVTPTPAGPPTATPPGFVPSPTPPGSSLPTVTPTPRIPQTPTPDTPPTPTPARCYDGEIPPMPLTLFEGTVPFNGSFNPPFTSYANRYIGTDPERYYDGNPLNAYVFGPVGTYYNMLPERNLWVRVNANRVVQATFDLPNTRFSRLDAPVPSYAFARSTLRDRNRELLLVLQDLGDDRRPSGDDALLAFLAMGDVDDDGDSNSAGRRLRVFGSRNDFLPDLVHGRPAGFQASRAPAVNAGFTGQIFSWVGNEPGTNWPEAPTANTPGRSWLWPSHMMHESALALRFVTQPNRVYRMFVYTNAPMCNGYAGATAQLVFHTLGDADMLIEKSAPAEAVREEQIGYSLTTRNIGTTEAQNVIVTDALPEGTTFVSADPPPSNVDGRRLTWNLGNVAPGAARSISLVVNVLASAPDTLTNVGEVRADNDSNLTNNRSEATTSLVRTNVSARMTATRMVRPGEAFEVRITYRNTSGTTARNARLTYTRPFGGVLLSSSRAPSASDATGMVWMLGDLAGGAEGTITLRLRALREDEAAALPAALEHVAVIAANQDADPRDNEARAVTALLVFPRPQGDLRMRIHSEFDRARLVYRTDGTAFAWPIGETLYFIPEVTLREPPIMSPPAYAARQRIVAWSFVGSGSLTLNGTGCRARETPPAAETAHADLSGMQGCVYRYRAEVGPSEMLSQGRLYWSAFAPESLASATYGIWPLPPSPTTIRIQYAVLTELVETGLYDIDEDGRSDSVLDRRTDIMGGTFTVTLVAPRDAR